MCKVVWPCWSLLCFSSSGKEGTVLVIISSVIVSNYCKDKSSWGSELDPKRRRQSSASDVPVTGMVNFHWPPPPLPSLIESCFLPGDWAHPGTCPRLRLWQTRLDVGVAGIEPWVLQGHEERDSPESQIQVSQWNSEIYIRCKGSE